MHTSGTEACEAGKELAGPSLPRWDRLMYLLVAFALFTVCGSLYVSHRYVQIYVRSVALNQVWTRRLHECSQLGQLAAGVNAPGNDVFQSHEAAAEEAKLRAAARLFDESLGRFQAELRADEDGAEAAALLNDLEDFRGLMQRMTDEARRLFRHLGDGRTTAAGESMAAMDRQYARANRALERSRGEIAAIQRRQLERQAEVAASLQRSQYLVSTLILTLIGASLAYGHRLHRQVEASAREKEVYIRALRESEADLDRRVRERTAELVRANESLRGSEARYRSLVEVRQQLLKKLLSAQEDERRRIARDLHDEIGQALTSLLIGLRTVAGAPALETARGRAEGLRQVAVTTLEEVRRLARGLRPSVLDDLGLAAALERYAADYARAHAVAVEVEALDPAAGRLPGEVETALYRITQEALTNTAKHAAAKHVRIAVERGPGFVQLVVADDGRGFAWPNPDPAGRLGLSGMQERAALLNGSVAVESGPGAGTRVTVRIPVAEEDHGENSRPGGG